MIFPFSKRALGFFQVYSTWRIVFILSRATLISIKFIKILIVLFKGKTIWIKKMIKKITSWISTSFLVYNNNSKKIKYKIDGPMKFKIKTIFLITWSQNISTFSFNLWFNNLNLKIFSQRFCFILVNSFTHLIILWIL